MIADATPTPEEISVGMGRWEVATAPRRLVTLLGSCVGVVLYERKAKVGGLAHIVLPDSRGQTDHPGKYADTAIPAMLAAMRRLIPPSAVCGRSTAKLIGGASMFQTSRAVANIGQTNQEAAERILNQLGITVVARDLGGESGRRVLVDLSTGIATVRLSGGESYLI